MSWDVIIINVPEDIETVSELTDDSTAPLGSKNYVLSAISNVFPHANVADPTWVVVDGESYSIEFSVGHQDEIEFLMLHVRGDANAIDAIECLCKLTGWHAFDTAMGDFIDFGANRDKGFRRWQQYRDLIKNKYSKIGRSCLGPS